MKNFVKCYKDFFGYFNALKTHGEQAISLYPPLYKLQLIIYLKESSEKLIEITHRVAENMELLVLWLLLMEMTLLCCRSSFSFPMT